MTRATEISYPFNSFVVLDGYADMTSMPAANRSIGMHVYVVDTDTIYVLSGDLTNWGISTLISAVDGYEPSSSLRLLPNGGGDGYLLQKASASNYDVEWVSPLTLVIDSGLPLGGTTGQVLTKDSGADYDASWQDIEANGLTISEFDAILDGYASINSWDGYASISLDNLSSTAVNTHIIPSVDNSITMGSGALKWQNIHAVNFYGTIDDGTIT